MEIDGKRLPPNRFRRCLNRLSESKEKAQLGAIHNYYSEETLLRGNPSGLDGLDGLDGLAGLDGLDFRPTRQRSPH
jgi:hypothetical protein